MYDLSPGILAVWLVLASLINAGLLNTNSLQASQALEKRSACYIDAYGKQYTCLSGYKCCTARYWATCIPVSSVCCDWGNWIGWCPKGATCAIQNRYPACIIESGQTVSAQTATTVATVPTTEKTSTTTKVPTVETTTTRSSNSDSDKPSQSPNPDPSGLSTGATIGIAVSVTCSVLGLIIGVWIKYHFSKKEANRERVG